MTSTSDPRDPKPFAVTGYPAPATSAAPAAAAAYAYPAPNPNPYYPNPNPNGYYPNTNPNGYYPNPNPNPNPYTVNAPFIRRLFAFIVAVFIAIAAITFIIWLVLRPKVPDFTVASLAVSSLNLSSNSLTANFDVQLTVANPNTKLRAGYYDVTAGVLYGGDVVADTKLPPFEQGTKNVTEIGAKMAAVGEYVSDDVANGIRSDRGSGDGVVKFDVRVLAIARFWTGGWRTRRHMLRVFCNGIGVALKNGTTGVGSMVGPARQCDVWL